jgi:hypothetical protein
MGVRSTSPLQSFVDDFYRSSSDAGVFYPEPVVNADLMLVAGGGSGGGSVGGGGGAGGILYASSIKLTSGAYVFVVGQGATGSATGTSGTKGVDSTFGVTGTAYLTAEGGGGGASSASGAGTPATDGGSGGGGTRYPGDSGPFAGGAADQPTTWNGPAPMSSGSTITGYANAGGTPSDSTNFGQGGGGAAAGGGNNDGGAGQPFSVVMIYHHQNHQQEQNLDHQHHLLHQWMLYR